MTTTLQALGGGAQPASIDTSGKTMGGPALRVYGFDSEAAAQAAGYVCEGGPAMSVALITDAQIANGEWKAEGDPSALVVYTAPGNMPVEGGLSVPVYPVNGWGSAPAPVGPQFSSAEIGAVNSSTLVVTFDQNVDASDYATGATIKVNGTATSITSAIRQSDNHAKVNYLIPVLWHGSGDAVTWEYDSGSGNIVAESGGAALEDVAAQSATNNCEYAALLDLQADTLALNDGDPVSTWADQSGQGHNFTQTGSERPTRQTISGFPVVDIDPNNSQWLDGGEFADNLPNWGMISTMHSYEYGGGENISIKETDEATSGWEVHIEAALIYGAGRSFTISGNMVPPQNTGLIASIFFTSINPPSGDLFVNSANTSPDIVEHGAVTDYSTVGTVKIGRYHDAHLSLYSVMLFAPFPNAANRAALEARLAARYGVTLP